MDFFVQSHSFRGSLIKLAFTEHSDDPEKIQIRCVTCRKDAIRDVLVFFKEQSGPALDLGNEPLITCGIGCGKNESLFNEILGVRLKNRNEFDCIVEAFIYLSGVIPTGEFLYPPNPKMKVIEREHIEDVERFTESYNQFSDIGSVWKISKEESTDDSNMSNSLPSKDDVDHDESVAQAVRSSLVSYPTIVAMCGSGGCPVLIRPDGTYQTSDVMPTNGRFLLGLGRMLTGAKSFEELITLAEKGDDRQVNQWGPDLVTDTEDPYGTMPRYMLTYGMGKAADKDLESFRREDLAATAVATVAESVAHNIHLWALIFNVKEVFFTGSVFDSHVYRDELDKYYTLRNAVNGLGKLTKHYFVRHGPYLGALGCVLKTLKIKPSK